MRHPTRTVRSSALAALATAAAAALLWTAGPVTAAATGASPLQEAAGPGVEEISVRIGPEIAELSAEMSDGSRTSIALEEGEVVVDGESRASYAAGGELESAWRSFLRSRVDPASGNIASSLRAWSPPSGAESGAAGALTDAVRGLAAAAGAATPDTLPAPAAPSAPSGDTVDLVGEGTSVAPAGRPLDELQANLDRLRRSLERVGTGAFSAVGTAALVVHDDYEIESGRSVAGAVALLSGELTVAGEVQGDVLVLDGDLILQQESTVHGDVLQVGGSVTNRGGDIGGQLVSVGGEETIAREMGETEDPAPPEPDRDSWEERYGPGQSVGYAVWDNVTDGVGSLFSTFSFFIVLAVIGAIPLYFARSKFETTAATVRHSFGRSFALGLAGQVLFAPALVVLTAGVLTIPLIPVFVLAVALAFVVGYVAVGYAVGDVIRERGYGWIRRAGSGPYRTLLVGLAALLTLFAIMSLLAFFGDVVELLYGLTVFAAVVVTWIAFTAGFGAVALSYAGTRDDYAGPGGPGGGEPPAAAAGAGTPPPPGPETGGPAPDGDDVSPGQGPPERSAPPESGGTGERERSRGPADDEAAADDGEGQRA